MLDFTSSLYLGMAHPSASLPGWGALTSGRPAVLGRPPVEAVVAGRLAALTGFPAAVLRRSSLHALSDCLEVLAGPHGTIHVDRATYSVAQWAVERAQGRGARVRAFDHHDPTSLAAALAESEGPDQVVVTDGLCARCGREAPLRAYAAATAEHGGHLLVDDTQALGVVGPHGGGTIRRHRPRSGRSARGVVVVASLAKGFGVPVAVVAGSETVVGRVAREGGSGSHSSPPTTVDLLAARAALDENERSGDAKRARLSSRVRDLRAAAAGTGLLLRGGDFPVQSTPPASRARAARLHRGLDAAGVRAVPTRDCRGPGVAVTLVVTLDHPSQDVRRAGALLGRLWAGTNRGDKARG